MTERVPLLPLKALAPRPRIQKPKKSPRLLLETSRTFKVVNVSDPPATSSVPLPSSIVQMNLENSISAMRASNLRSPSSVSLQRIPQLSLSPDATRPSRLPSPNTKIRFVSTSSPCLSPSPDASSGASNERRQSQKPLPRLPRGQRQRVSMKPPSFIPLDWEALRSRLR